MKCTKCNEEFDTREVTKQPAPFYRLFFCSKECRDAFHKEQSRGHKTRTWQLINLNRPPAEKRNPER